MTRKIGGDSMFHFFDKERTIAGSGFNSKKSLIQ
jgi:hypothetical protein